MLTCGSLEKESLSLKSRETVNQPLYVEVHKMKVFKRRWRKDRAMTLIQSMRLLMSRFSGLIPPSTEKSSKWIKNVFVGSNSNSKYSKSRDSGIPNKKKKSMKLKQNNHNNNKIIKVEKIGNSPITMSTTATMSSVSNTSEQAYIQYMAGEKVCKVLEQRRSRKIHHEKIQTLH